MRIIIYIYIYIRRKVEKTNNTKFDESIMKVDVERFGCHKLLQDIKFMKILLK